MRKVFVFVMALFIVLSFVKVSSAVATNGNDCNGNDSCSITNNTYNTTTNQGGTGGAGGSATATATVGNVSGGSVTDNSKTYNTNTNINSANGGSATIQKGAVENNNNVNVGNGINNFSPSASAKIEKGAVQNYNTNKQQQGQIQGQVQGQKQNQAIVGSGNSKNTVTTEVNNGQMINPQQNVTFIAPENKRDLPGFYGYQAPGVGDYRGPYEKGIQLKAKPWTMQESWGKDEIEGFYSMNDTAKCKVFVVKKIREATDALKIAKEGSISCILECSADSGFELWGTAAKKAMECGAKSIEESAYSVTYANKSDGWNIGFGGGVTAINGGNDNYGGSVGGGTGIGSVTTGPVEKVKAIFIAH